MTDFAGFPSNNVSFNFENLGPAIAGLIVRDQSGTPLPGILPSRDALLTTDSGWYLNAYSFVAVRVKGKAVLVGGTTDNTTVSIEPPSSSSPRIDVIWTRPADMDAGEENIPLQVAKGTPAAVPQKPSLPAEAIEVAALTIPGSATSTTACTLAMTFKQTACAGGVVPFRTTTELNAWSGVNGQYATVAGVLYVRKTNVWYAVVPAPPVIPKVPGLYATSVNVATAAGTDQAGSAAVTFPAGRFAVAPYISVSIYSSLTGLPTVSFSGLSKNGVTVNVRRTASTDTSTTVHVIAVTNP